MNCPQCKGKGEVTCTIHEAKGTSHMDLPCPTCNGRKTVTAAENKAYHDMVAAWCSCGNPSGESEHHNFRSGGDYYTCRDCGKITQTG